MKPLRVCLVLWSGGIGGAETWMLALARSLRRRGVDAGVLFIGSPEPLASQLDTVPWSTLGLERGAQVILKPRTFASLVDRIGPDAALLPATGYLARMLRIGGYRGRIAAIEHGSALQLGHQIWWRRWVRSIDMLSGRGVSDVLIAPSDFMLHRLRRLSRATRYARIYPGIRLDRFTPGSGAAGTSRDITIGCAARLIDGKGVDVLLKAVARLGVATPVALQIAGDGPMKRELIQLARDLGLERVTRFLGSVPDMPAFWRSCDVAVVPSSTWVESFGMVAAEAMACGMPVLASRQGGLPELVLDGSTGYLFEPGDHEQLADLLARYAKDPALRGAHGHAAMEHSRARFDISRSARELEELLRPEIIHAN
ncbi:MAG TPA: glycosyltransferase family 4 protein [Candidatus Eisenbacteria bacterium]|nr:glycosyltransferase family 4 protein [Candidatus Eisenbacteria bacterium]